MKKLNTDSITNELANSSFFPSRSISSSEGSTAKPIPPEPAAEPVKPAVVHAAPQTTPTPVPQTRVAPAVAMAAPAGRPYIRRTFDFYEDQIAYLTKASLEERLASNDASMNAMVREAIDTYIANRRKT